MLVQDALIPGQAQWFHSALILFVRMTFATVIMAILFHRQLRSMGKNEGRQGIALGLFGGVGMLLQTDAQHLIQASTSAFFTQFTCIFVPIAVALRNRAWPTARVALSCFLVLFGCAALSGFSPTGVAFGRGEWETITAAILFTGQILVLEKECYQNNEMRSTATMMFAVKALVLAPILLLDARLTPEARTGWTLWLEITNALQSAPVILMVTLLTVFSTVFGYATMTRWQPFVSPVQAGLIYATEPIFATLWALFLPSWFARMGGINYSNESLSLPFGFGAALILGANLLLIGGNQETPKKVEIQ